MTEKYGWNSQSAILSNALAQAPKPVIDLLLLLGKRECKLTLDRVGEMPIHFEFGCHTVEDGYLFGEQLAQAIIATGKAI